MTNNQKIELFYNYEKSLSDFKYALGAAVYGSEKYSEMDIKARAIEIRQLRKKIINFLGE